MKLQFNSINAKLVKTKVWNKNEQENDKQLNYVLKVILEAIEQQDVKTSSTPQLSIVVPCLNHLVCSELEDRGFKVTTVPIEKGFYILNIQFSKNYFNEK